MFERLNYLSKIVWLQKAKGVLKNKTILIQVRLYREADTHLLHSLFYIVCCSWQIDENHDEKCVCNSVDKYRYDTAFFVVWEIIVFIAYL